MTAEIKELFRFFREINVASMRPRSNDRGNFLGCVVQGCPVSRFNEAAI